MGRSEAREEVVRVTLLPPEDNVEAVVDVMELVVKVVTTPPVHEGVVVMGVDVFISDPPRGEGVEWTDSVE
jgi:hypothetical protein